MVLPGSKIDEDGKVHAFIKYVENFTEFSQGDPDLQEGNYFPLKLAGVGEKIEVKKNGELVKTVKWDPKWVIRIEDPNDKFEFIVDGKSIMTLDFSECTYLKLPNKVLSVLAQDHQMGNKPVSELQSELVISNDGKITGTSSYVADLELSTGAKDPANYICLHVENTQLPAGTITLGINNLTNVDTKDYDVLLKVDNKSKLKPLRIAVDGKVLYQYNLKELILEP